MARRFNGLGVDWYVPGKKRRFATTTQATSDLVVLVAAQGLSVAESIGLIHYDDDAKRVLQHLANHGHADTMLSTLVR